MRRKKPKAPLTVELESSEQKESKHPYRLTRDEREVIIGKSDSEDIWHVYSSSLPTMRRLDKWAKVVNEERMNGEVVSKEYEVPKASVSIHKPRKVSEAQRQRALQMGLERQQKIREASEEDE